MSSDMKKHIQMNLMTVGTPNAGKSTLGYYLSFALGGVYERELAKLKQEALNKGKSSSLFSFYVSKSKEEQAKNASINSKYKQFFTESYCYNIIDVAGHKHCVSDLIVGLIKSDVVILTVPATTNVFERSVSIEYINNIKNIGGHTIHHARLCYAFGIQQIIVCINKMDHPSVNYNQNRYNQVKKSMSSMLATIGFKTRKVMFIPITAITGDNVITKSKNMQWFKGWNYKIHRNKITGHTLCDALDKLMRPVNRARAIVRRSLRIPVCSITKKKGVGTVICGTIAQGRLDSMCQLKFYPSGCKTNIRSIEIDNKTVNQASSGDNVKIYLRRKDFDRNNIPKVGDVIGSPSYYFNCYYYYHHDPYPISKSKRFRVLVYVVHNHVISKKSICNKFYCGYKLMIHCGTAKAECCIIKMNRKNWKIEDPNYIECGDTAEIEFEKRQDIVLCEFDRCKKLGRIACINSKNVLVMIGKVMDVTDAK